MTKKSDTAIEAFERLRRDGSDNVVTFTKPRSRGAAQKNTQAKVQLRYDRILAAFERFKQDDDLPTNTRAVFYLLVALFPKDYEKTSLFAETINADIGFLRRNGQIPFGWITNSRGTQSTPPGAFDEEATRLLVIQAFEMGGVDRQSLQPVFQIVLAEAEDLVSRLAVVADTFGVAVWSASGTTTIGAKYRLAELLAEQEKPCVVHHFGDLDTGGENIFQNLREDVTALLADFFPESTSTVVFKRIAIRPAQIEQFGLPSAPAKKPKRNQREFKQPLTAQIDGMTKAVRDQLLSDALTPCFDHGIDDEAMAFKASRRADFLGEYGIDE